MRVFLTGGANGIGRATVDRLLEQGHEVAVFDIDQDGLDALPDAVDTYHGDVADRDRVETVIDQETFDVLVNDAGFQARGTLEDMEHETVKQHFETNVYGLLHATRAALPMLRERDGRIVNIASLAGQIAAPTWGAYAASKHAVEALSDALRMEVAPFDVDVVIIEPGPVRTGFNEQGRDHMEQYLPDTPYADRYRDALEQEQGGVSPENAAKTVVKAVTARRPRTRYRIGWQAYIAPRVRCLLPERLWDWLVQRF